MISINDVRVIYGRNVILKGCSLSVIPGECVGLLGPSGSGKSTILRLLTGDQFPQSGEVSVGAWKPSSGRRTRTPPAGLIGVVHQDPVGSLDRFWSVRRAVAEPLSGRRSSEPSDARVESMLVHVRLGHIDPGMNVRSLSVGQAQRVAMARALIAKPNVLLADEPTSALDPTTAATIVLLLREAANEGAATLVVSHNEPLLRSFCDRILVLNAGRIEA